MKKIPKKILLLIDAICVGLLVLILLCIGTQIICRTFEIGISWTEELARMSFIFMSFLGAILALAEGSHIVIDVILNRLPKKAKVVLDIFVNLIVMTFMTIGIKGVFANLKSYKGVTAVSMMWFKMNYIYIAIFVAFIIIIITCIVRMVCIIKGNDPNYCILPEEEREEVNIL